MQYVCNPINMEYKYQFIEYNGELQINRESADPSMVYFNGQYYLFPSMTAGFLVSEDLVDWSFHSLKNLPIYEYAPDVRVLGEYLYFSASSAHICSFYRTKDPINGSFEKIEGTFAFWDPNLFMDEDGKVYFYWGCSNDKPIFGVEMNPENMKPKSEPVELIFSDPTVKGYERVGENHIPPRTQEQIEELLQNYASNNPNADAAMLEQLRTWLDHTPYIEGAWMDKHQGKYYLQYASPATENNVYSDAVYVSDNPLGPFSLARNNPYSYKPGGFIPGAGHGSTMQDRHGNFWHTSSMRISVNHNFERRLGLWPAGFDQDGELFCNQRYGDWPMKIEQATMNPWSNPDWMLLSYGKPANASSYEEGKGASMATDENVRTWWKAASNKSGEWLQIDLKEICDVYAVHMNFADDGMKGLSFPAGAKLHQEGQLRRYIDEQRHYTRWLLEGSLDGKVYFIIEDKSNADTDLPHDLIVREEGIKARYIRCTIIELPYNQPACISGLRIFGIGNVELPDAAVEVKMTWMSDLDLHITWKQKEDAVGYNVLWGYAPDKLYHSFMVFGSNEVTIGALIKGEPVYIRVDVFNEKGITEGGVLKGHS